MLSARLKARCPSARVLGIAEFPGHQLRWHKRSADGSGKCDAVPASAAQSVFGVVYEIDANEKAALDQAEGLGHGYDQKGATVIVNSDTVAVSIYFATRTDPSLKPYSWYKTIVVAGATEHDLPASYIAGLEAVDTSEDPDRKRHDRNMRMVTAAGRTCGDQA